MAWGDHLERADDAAREILGQSVVYAPSVGSPVTVTGIFEPHYQQPTGPGAFSIDGGGVGPAVFLKLDELPTDPETDAPTVTISGESYTVHKAHKDGTGAVVLLLNAAGS